ncbi:tripartite tricarboxylate transporter TctB family protein [Hoyosella sp. YIM 151337]|uniref:tripartite tricarboxylate transporter TctB family protein n=1 Tax=Hoyosella sp. YIM 151337 TaxID=2992742 RepID=UPI002235F048|nr:tripartite tricarboxylate transporter TctB family protein [Hoyosella sp. YIM 151337]MCW4353764.1 tripartite tricarboxylate transporter TctB family protein [Hoyosella sp. YIM 151337]
MKTFTFGQRTLGIAIGVVALIYLFLATQISEFTAVDVPVQPATLPKGLGLVLLLLAVVLFFQRGEPKSLAQAAVPAVVDARVAATQAVAAEAEDPQSPRLGRTGNPAYEVAIFVASMCVYAFAFERLGFILATAAYIFGVTWYLGYKRHLVTAIVSITVPLILYFSITAGLGVALPNGLIPLPF